MGEPKATSGDGSMGGGDNASYAAPDTKGGSGYSVGGSAFSLASIGLQSYGAVLGGKGEQAADEYKAARLERAAEVGRVAASQSGAQFSEDLAMTLGNIDTIRAAAHDDPTSPTGAILRDRATQLGTRARVTDQATRQAQIDQQGSDAAALRTAGKQALLAGYIKGGAGVLGALGKGLQ
ncbi:MAG: hypothetical protein ABIO35_08305 [Nitrobacter sp.]